MIVVIDYGMGNIGTVATKVRKMTNSVLVSSRPSDILGAEKLILPGVGSFHAAIENLSLHGLIEPLTEAVLLNKTPILGICLGMQLFTKKSEEGGVAGLGWIDAETVRFRFVHPQNGLKIPHMGWNTLNVTQQHPILARLDANHRFYFVHSYHVQCNNKENMVALTEYGYQFPSIISQGNIVGLQFHPERSHKFGLQILKNFIGDT